jgi:hypothetical protein
MYSNTLLNEQEIKILANTMKDLGYNLIQHVDYSKLIYRKNTLNSE